MSSIRIAVFISCLVLLQSNAAALELQSSERESLKHVDCYMESCDGIGYGSSVEKAKLNCGGSGPGGTGFCGNTSGGEKGCWIAGSGPVQTTATTECPDPDLDVCTATCTQQFMICCDDGWGDI